MVAAVEGERKVVLGLVGVEAVFGALSNQEGRVGGGGSSALDLLVGSRQDKRLLVVHLPAVDGLLMATVHVGHPVLILHVIEKQIPLGVLAQDAEQGGLALHPVELFYQRVVRNALHRHETAS